MQSDRPDSREVEVTRCPCCRGAADRYEINPRRRVRVIDDDGVEYTTWKHATHGYRATAALATTADRVAVLEAALRTVVELYDTDEGCRTLPQILAARTALATVDLPRLDLAKD